MWQEGWTFDALHKKYTRYQANPWPPLFETHEQFHMWLPLESHLVEQYAAQGWIFNYLTMRWDNQHQDRHVDFEPYPDVEVRHYPEFRLPGDVREVQRANDEGFFYAQPPPFGQYRTSDTAEDEVRNCPSTGLVP